MNYKEQKLKEFEDRMVVSSKSALAAIRESKAFISSTIDEIMGCLPELVNPQSNDFSHNGFDVGFNSYRFSFLKNLEEKAIK